MRTIQLEVKEDTAKKIEMLSKQEKSELGRFLNIWINDRRSLREVMDDMRAYARRQGLTPDLLHELLKEE